METTHPNDLPGAIAIIGMAGRFPKSMNLDLFWQNLRDGRELVSFFSEEELIAAGNDPELIKNPSYVPARAVLEEGEFFDAAFFGFSPREAEIIDPQQRLFLECAWEAVENAGYDTERFTGAVGVFGGMSMNSYLSNNVQANPDILTKMGFYQIMLGNDKDFLTTRVSYKLNLKGPSINVQTACSTSLVAVQLACQSLLNFQCDMALAGGVSLYSPRKGGYLYQAGMILSPDGHCRAFDHKAQGIVGGEGVGIVVLKRYSEAVKDGDTIHAIIRGAAINNDGGLKVGYTAPSVDGQSEAILMAQALAGVEPRSITYVETHGTGTELGDPIEIAALTQSFRTGTQDKGFCAIGSVKTNMGHLDSGAGIAGLIKTVLALKHKMIPPSLHFEKPNPRIDFENSPFYVNASLKEWATDRLPRRAAVSSFGIGGTNAHAVLEEAPSAQSHPSSHPEQLLLLSARSEAALNAATKNMVAWLRDNPTENLADVAYTLQIGRKVFKQRRMLVCGSAEEAISILEEPDLKRAPSMAQDARDTPVAFLFPGQGAQYIQMGKGLYETEQYFRQQVDYCANLLKPHLGFDLRDVLFPPPEFSSQAEERIQQTWITQPALFTIEYSLAKLWMSWGIKPKAMVGHSIGEYVAACVAGVFTLEDALALVAARGKLMQSLPGGSMLAVPLPEPDILPLLGNDLSLAVINAPRMCVVSGSYEAIDRLNSDLTARGVACRKLRTSHAFHSLMMDPILDQFTELVKSVSRHAPEIPYLSNVTGGWITAEQATSPSYWASHLRSSVRFAQNLEVLFKETPILLEVGPGQTLSSLARQHPKKSANQAILSSLRHPQEQISDTVFITNSLGRLWLSGASPDWQAYHAGDTRRRIPLPTYPFEHKRYWIEPKKAGSVQVDAKTKLGKRKDLSSWFYIPSWQRSAWPVPQPGPLQKHTWLVFSDNLGLGESIIKGLEKEGHTVVTVLPADAFTQASDRVFALKPGDFGQYASLLKALEGQKINPTRMIHLWTLTPDLPKTLDEMDEMQARGFYSLLAFTQAWGESEFKNKLQLVAVSNQLHQVTGAEPLSPAKATILGPCKVISQEYPDITCRSVDIILPISQKQDFAQVEKQILAEFEINRSQSVIAYREAHRWIQTYHPHPLPASSPEQLPLREHGVYLITGGYGGIGLTLAGYLAESVHARLVLVGRSGLPDRSVWQEWLSSHDKKEPISQKIQSIQELENKGASVLLLKANVADLAQMTSAIQQARNHFGHLNGVIHAAGIAGGGVIQLKTKDQASRVLSSKVRGTWVLDQLLQTEPLDFLLLCSSINAIIGGAGQVDYSAANAFLDSFAQLRNSSDSHCRTIAVNWTAWQEVGMAVETEVPAHLMRWKEENLRTGIHPTEGIEAFKRILANPLPQIIVSPPDLQAIIDLVEDRSTRTKDTTEVSAEASDIDQSAQEEHEGRPEVQSNYAPPGNAIEKQMVEIWQELIGVEPIGINDNFFELGGHSLLATQILLRIRDAFKVEMSLRSFFETSTIAELSKRIEAMQWVERNQDTPPSASDDREEIAL